MWAVLSVPSLPIPVLLIALTILIIPKCPVVVVEIKLDLNYIAVRKQLHI